MYVEFGVDLVKSEVWWLGRKILGGVEECGDDVRVVRDGV